MTYHTVTAAEALMTGASRGAWALADALVADIPERPVGRPKTNGAHVDITPLDDALVAICGALDDAGITTPNGDSYTLNGLRAARATAIAWPEPQRHPEAAYRTHQEIGSEQRREVLDALCRYSQGEKVAAPQWVDDRAFDSACQMVESNLRRRYPVSANAVRVAMQRKPNVDKAPSTTFEMLASLNGMKSNAESFVNSMNKNGVGLTDDERDAMGNAIRGLIGVLHDIWTQVVGVTDDEIEQLMSGGIN